jgi:hypothetical protein
MIRAVSIRAIRRIPLTLVMASLASLGLSVASVADSLHFGAGAERQVPPEHVTPAYPPPAEGTSKRIQITGEIIDAWCQVTGIMGIGVGTGHHQCAIWCAAGGGPIGIQGTDGVAYILLKVEGHDPIASQTAIDFETDEVKVDADWYVRDGVNYLVVNKILENHGVVNRNHEKYGIVPFGE